MKIYTRGGDEGETGLLGGQRVAKDDVRVEACGVLDELSAAIGLAVAQGEADPLPESVPSGLRQIQEELFALGAVIARTGTTDTDSAELSSEDALAQAGLWQAAVDRMETQIDQYEATLPPLKNFILPGGTLAATGLHWARVVCRRAERRLVTLQRDARLNVPAIAYLNRLGDLLFVLARVANRSSNVPDIIWPGFSPENAP